MTEDEATLWCEQRKIEIYRYHDNTAERDFYNLTGWANDRREVRMRIHVVAATLLEAVRKVQQKIDLWMGA